MARPVPLLPLRDIVVFPHMVVPLFVGREKSIGALEEVTARGAYKEIFLSAQRRAKTNEPLAPELLVSVQTIDDPGQLADTIAGQLQLKITDKQALLEMTSPLERLGRLYELLKAEMEILQVERKIRTRVKRQMEKTQREYYLNEQMQAIQKELGDRDEFKNELGELEERANHKHLSKEAAAKVKKEL